MAKQNLDQVNKKIAEATADINKKIIDRVITILPDEVQEHLANSYLEFLLAFQSMIEFKIKKKKKDMKKIEIE